eukprot:1160707-Pelagomonas_calceolata.AAC.1
MAKNVCAQTVMWLTYYPASSANSHASHPSFPIVDPQQAWLLASDPVTRIERKGNSYIAVLAYVGSFACDARGRSAGVGSCNAHRKERLLASDPAARMGVVEALRQGLGAAEALHGPVFHASMARLDPTLQQQVAAALGGRSLG